MICSSPMFGEALPRFAAPEMSRAQIGLPASVAPSQNSNAPRCELGGEKDVIVACNYTPVPHFRSDAVVKPRIVLNHLVISFAENKKSNLQIELTFTNEGRTRLFDNRTVYLAIDDDAGRNYLRRVLPEVNLRKLAPGERLTFSDRLLSPAFPSGHYLIHLWIPSADHALRTDAVHNLLLTSVGVPDPATGLNTLASLTIRTAMPAGH